MKRILLSLAIGVILSLGLYAFNPVIHEYVTCGVIAAIIGGICYFVFLQKSKNAFIKFFIILIVSFCIARYFYYSVTINEKAAICFNIIPFVVVAYWVLGPFMKKR